MVWHPWRNYLELHSISSVQDSVHPKTMLPSRSQISAPMGRTHMMRLLLIAKLTKAGGLRTVLSICLFYVPVSPILPLYRPPLEKKGQEKQKRVMICVFSELPYVLNLSEDSKWPTGEREGGREGVSPIYLCLCLFVHICSQTPAQTTSNCWRLEEGQHKIRAHEIKISP